MKLNPIFPSILSTDFLDLESRLNAFKENGIDYIHLDVMDGHFVTNLSFGPSAVKPLKKAFDFKVDAHLMVDLPDRMIPWFIDAGADWVSFHLEVMDTPQQTRENIALIKNAGRQAGLVINPDKPVQELFPYLEEVDYVLLMSVFPGRGGQKFITETINKVTTLKNEINRLGTQCLIQVDGGINDTIAGQLKAAGADLVVIGTYLYNSTDIETTIRNVLNSIETSGD